MAVQCSWAPMANFTMLLVAQALCACIAGVQQQIAPFDADLECLNSSSPLGQNGSSFQSVLLDSYQYRSLQTLWFPDDEDIDLFEFPVPEDRVRWELVDQSECRNVWQYCGTSFSDILITQFITGALNRSNDEVAVSVEYAFFNNETAEINNGIIIEVDDTTGLSNVHTELIPYTGTQQPLYHDFIYTPMNQYFEIVFRTNLTEGTCVNISRVRVFHCGRDGLVVENLDSLIVTCIPCPGGYYLDAELNECLPCPSHSSSTSARSNCVCDIGYQRSSNPTNYLLPCDQCASGYVYMTANDLCVACPIPGFDDGGGMVDDCRCFSERSSVHNLTCNFCAENYIRNSSMDECVLCPAGSRRELLLDTSGLPSMELEQFCACTEGSCTGNGDNITELEPCDDCDELLYLNSTMCVPCPAHSQRLVTDTTQCRCDFGSLTLAGQNLTTTESCFCMSELYRASGSNQCEACPANSYRALNEPEEFCGCLEGHRRENRTISLPCFAYIGFNTSSVVFREGNGVQTHNITILLSLLSTSTLSVSINVMALDQNRNVEVGPSNVTFLPGTDRSDVMLSYMGNLVALEDNVILNLYLAEDVEELLIGGSELYGDLGIVIRDDDLLYVGFTENRLIYNSSEQGGSIGLNISTTIGQNLVLLIRSNDTLSSNDPTPQTFIFTVGENATSKAFHFNLSGNGDNRYVLLRVEVATYPESLNRVRDRVTVGQMEGLYHEVVIVIEGPRGVLSMSAMIGVVASVAAVCFNVIVVVVIFCVCCKKHMLKVETERTQQPSPTRLQEVEMSKLTESLEAREND